MNIHEYQAKNLLKSFGVSVNEGVVIEKISDFERKIGTLRSGSYVVKAQVHSGGRGKAGGVKFAKTKADALEHAKNILGMTLVTPQTGPQGKLVQKILVTEAADIAKEYYLSFLIDRGTCKYVYIGSTEGGVEIEKVAEETPDKIAKIFVDPVGGFKAYHAVDMARALKLDDTVVKELISIMKGMYDLFTQKDASLVEINPLIMTKEGHLMAIDAKVGFDGNALYRHPDILELRDLNEEDPNEVQASKFDLSYIKLDGTIGCLVNGAGLAMATMDIVKFYGGGPANFLDVGGSASTEKVTEAFKIILSDPNVKGILVNIFGGIMKCDIIATGIVEASKALGVKVPIVARLDGTNIEQGKRILAESELKIIPASSMKEAAERVVKEASAHGHSSR